MLQPPCFSPDEFPHQSINFISIDYFRVYSQPTVSWCTEDNGLLSAACIIIFTAIRAAPDSCIALSPLARKKLAAVFGTVAPNPLKSNLWQQRFTSSHLTPSHPSARMVPSNATTLSCCADGASRPCTWTAYSLCARLLTCTARASSQLLEEPAF